MNKKLQSIYALFVIGVLFISASIFLFKTEGPSTEKLGLKIATISKESGQINLIRGQQNVQIKVINKADIFKSDSLESKEASSGLITFENGARIQLQPNTIISMDQDESADRDALIIVLKRGEIRVDQAARTGKLWISKNNEKIESVLYEDSQLKQQMTTYSPKNSSSRISENAKSLSEEEISNTLGQFKNNFFKCYTNYLQKNPEATGDATLNFTIEPNGKVSFPVVSSSFKDESFENCLKNILERIEFKGFAGSPISTIFPLEFN